MKLLKFLVAISAVFPLSLAISDSKHGQPHVTRTDLQLLTMDTTITALKDHTFTATETLNVVHNCTTSHVHETISATPDLVLIRTSLHYWQEAHFKATTTHRVTHMKVARQAFAATVTTTNHFAPAGVPWVIEQGHIQHGAPKGHAPLRPSGPVPVDDMDIAPAHTVFSEHTNPVTTTIGVPSSSPDAALSGALTMTTTLYNTDGQPTETVTEIATSVLGGPQNGTFPSTSSLSRLIVNGVRVGEPSRTIFVLDPQSQLPKLTTNLGGEVSTLTPFPITKTEPAPVASNVVANATEVLASTRTEPAPVASNAANATEVLASQPRPSNGSHLYESDHAPGPNTTVANEHLHPYDGKTAHTGRYQGMFGDQHRDEDAHGMRKHRNHEREAESAHAPAACNPAHENGRGGNCTHESHAPAGYQWPTWMRTTRRYERKPPLTDSSGYAVLPSVRLFPEHLTSAATTSRNATAPAYPHPTSFAVGNHTAVGRARTTYTIRITTTLLVHNTVHLSRPSTSFSGVDGTRAMPSGGMPSMSSGTQAVSNWTHPFSNSTYYLPRHRAPGFIRPAPGHGPVKPSAPAYPLRNSTNHDVSDSGLHPSAQTPPSPSAPVYGGNHIQPSPAVTGDSEESMDQSLLPQAPSEAPSTQLSPQQPAQPDERPPPQTELGPNHEPALTGAGAGSGAGGGARPPGSPFAALGLLFFVLFV